MPVSANEFVYGDLSVPTLGTILDAVGLEEVETFLDEDLEMVHASPGHHFYAIQPR